MTVEHEESRHAMWREEVHWNHLYRTVDRPSVAAVLVRNLVDHEIVGEHRGLYLRALVTLERHAARQRRLRIAFAALSALPRGVARLLRSLRGKPPQPALQVDAGELLRDQRFISEMARALEGLRPAASELPQGAGRQQAEQT